MNETFAKSIVWIGSSRRDFKLFPFAQENRYEKEKERQDAALDVFVTNWPAKLRDLKTDQNLQLLKCKMKAAGHGGMSGRDNAIAELAEEYSFVLKTAKIKINEKI